MNFEIGSVEATENARNAQRIGTNISRADLISIDSKKPLISSLPEHAAIVLELIVLDFYSCGSICMFVCV